MTQAETCNGRCNAESCKSRALLCLPDSTLPPPYFTLLADCVSVDGRTPNDTSSLEHGVPLRMDDAGAAAALWSLISSQCR